MGEQSNTGASIIHKVWTFQLLSGPSFQLKLPGNPVLEFEGQQIIWKMISSQTVAQDAKKLMESMGVKVFLFSEEENDEMVAEREHLQHLNLDDLFH